MPTSTYSHIPAFINILSSIKPNTILDVGIGNGKMGFLARDLLDVMYGQQHRKEKWRVIIDGIEVFEDYIQEHQKAIYNDIYIGDAFEVINTLGNYDLIILGDVLEHFKKEKAFNFLDMCFTHTNHHIILNIPLGEKWTQPAIYGNTHEEHLSFWSFEEFGHLATDNYIYSFPYGDYACFLLAKDKYMRKTLRKKINPNQTLMQLMERAKDQAKRNKYTVSEKTYK